MHRANRIVSHLTGNQSAAQLSAAPTSGKSEDDIVIVAAVRTPIGRAGKGSFKDTPAMHLLKSALEGCVSRAGIDPKLVDEITVGNVLAPGAFATQARMASLLSGFPDSTAVHTTNRQCSSGLQAFATVASAIKAGFYEIGIAAGVESMSTFSMGASVGDVPDAVFKHSAAKNCLIPMGVTSENVAAKFGVTRDQQDAMAVDSHNKALRAQAEGRFTEIVPVSTTVKTKEGEMKNITVTKDEGPRKGSSTERLAKLRTVFKKVGGTTTAGNASQVSDGAAAVLAMKRSKAKELGLKIVGSFKGFSAVGCAPEIMGIGPAVAIPAVLKQTGLNINDIDIFEVNEAFASQATYCVKKLNIPAEKLNPNGGAIALGHPLGCTGARMIATLLSELNRTKKQKGIVSMCIGTGMGAAAVFEAEQ